MATFKQTDEKSNQSRRSYYTPFTANTFDGYQGSVRNLVLLKDKDPNTGEFSYFSPRPTLTGVEYMRNYDGSTPISGRGFLAGSNTYHFATPEGFFFEVPWVLNRYRNAVAAASGVSIINCHPDGTSTVDPGNNVANMWNQSRSLSTSANALQLVGFSKIEQYDNTETSASYSIYIEPPAPPSYSPPGISRMFVHRHNEPTTVYDTCDGYALPFHANPHCVALDGMLFVAEWGTDKIYNCEVNDLSSWNLSVNIIRASQFPGAIRALGRINNYIVAYKDNSIEFLYNAGLSDTSPLQRNTSYTKQATLESVGSLAAINNRAWFIGTEPTGDWRVFELSETKCEVISTPAVEATLKNLPRPTASGHPREVCPLTPYIRGVFLSVAGKRYYVINPTAYQHADGTTPIYSALRGSIVYDIDEKIWYNWDEQNPLLVYDSVGLPTLEGDRYHINKDGNLMAGDYVHDDAYTSYIDSDVETYYRVTYGLQLPNTDLNSTNRKFIHEIALAGYAPAPPDTVMTHNMRLEKTGGYGPTTVAQATTNSNNMSFRNWGQAVSWVINYEGVPSVNFKQWRYRILGLHMEVSIGVS